MPAIGTIMRHGALAAGLGLVALAGWHGSTAHAGTPQEAAVQAMLDPSSGPAFAAGAKVYREHCAACHDSGAGRAPLRIVLLQLTPETIHQVVTTGPMKAQAAALAPGERTAVAEYLSAQKLGTSAPPPFLRCTGAAARFDWREPPVFDGIGLDPAGTHTIPDAVAGLTPADLGKLRLKWAFAVPGANRLRSQPALAGGALTFGSSTGQVFSLDRATGCVRWTFSAPSEVRTAVLVQNWREGDAKARPLVWFGDITGNVHALDAVTGKPRWRRKITDHAGALPRRALRPHLKP